MNLPPKKVDIPQISGIDAVYAYVCLPVLDEQSNFGLTICFERGGVRDGQFFLSLLDSVLDRIQVDI